jgi:voltage-gated potassium channel
MPAGRDRTGTRERRTVAGLGSGQHLNTWYERLTVVRAVRTIVAIATLLVLIGGILARIVEPETFTSIGISYWWALTTITTVGYGDIVPHDTAGRLVGSLLMLAGISLIPTLTSAVVSVLIAKRGRSELEEQQRFREEQRALLARIEAQLAGLDGSAAAPPESRPREDS